MDRALFPRVRKLLSKRIHTSRLLSSAVLAVTLAATCAHFPGYAHATDPDASSSENARAASPEASWDRSVAIDDDVTPLASTIASGLTDPLDATSEAAQADYAEAARTAQVETVVEEALSHTGTRYVSGGMKPGGFDCSGLVKYVFDTMLGMDLPRTTYSQVNLGTEVSLSEAQRGDLVFWGSRTSPYHVGICLGDGTYVHAANYGKGVRVDSFDYYKPSFAKRVL